MDRRNFHRLALGGMAAALGHALNGCIAPPGGPAEGTSRARVPVPGRGRRAREIERVTESARQLEGAGFPVRRPFPTAALSLVDPFVLLDEMGPVDWAPGEARGAPDHPHRGFETVTYMLSGRFEHKDSFGGRGTLDPGDVQWMTAGAGVVHSEMPGDAIVASGGRIHGFQLWVNLPARDKWVRPRYQPLTRGEIPVGGTDDGRVQAHVIAGDALGARARVETHTPIAYQHWRIRPRGRVVHPVPSAHTASVVVFRGAVAIGEARQRVDEGRIALLGPGDTLTLSAVDGAGTDAELLLLSGVPIGEPVARRGPFVMNTDEEIRQAFEDYRAGRMGRIAG